MISTSASFEPDAASMTTSGVDVSGCAVAAAEGACAGEPDAQIASRTLSLSESFPARVRVRGDGGLTRTESVTSFDVRSSVGARRRRGAR